MRLGSGMTDKTGFNALSPDLVARLNKAAGKETPAQVEETPATPTAAPISQPKAATAKADTQGAGSSPPPSNSPQPRAEAKPAPPPEGGEGSGKEDTAKQTPKQLREAYEKAQAKVTELETTMGATSKEKADAFARLAAAEEKLKGFELRLKDEWEPLRKAHEETSKRLQEREEALRIRDYTATTEWHERYVKPIVETQQEALQFVGELVATTEDGGQVQATQEHLNYILGAPNANEAARRSEQLFGQNSPFTPTLVNYRTKLRALQAKQGEALKNAQLESAQWQERAQQQQAEQLQRLKAFVQEKERTLRGPDFEVGEDTELKQALEEGMELADTLVNGRPDLTPEAWGEVIAKGRVHIQRSHVLEKRLARAEAELKAANEELARYRGSEPTVETRNAGAPAPTADDGGDWKNGAMQRLMGRLSQTR